MGTAGRWSRLTLSCGLRFERNRTFDTQPLDPTFPFDLTVHIGRLTSSAAWDSRDDPSDSTRGTFVSTSLEHSTSRLGSDLFFVRSLTQAYHFIPWKEVVFASAARYGAVQPLGGQLLASSLASLRAAAGRSAVLPMTASAGSMCSEPAWRPRLLTLNQEMRFPVPMAPRSGVHRCGQRVPVDFRRAHPGSRRVHGVGLRLVTPFALFRVDYGKTIWNRPADDSGRVVFGIGQTF